MKANSAKIKTGKKRILILDDHPMTRDGLSYLIEGEADLKVEWKAEDAKEALEVITRERPDLVLTDLTLPDKNGLELIKDMRALRPDLAILVVSMHDETLYAERVLKAGARGYITKHAGGDRLMKAIRDVLGGNIAVSGKITARIMEAFSGRAKGSDNSPVSRLSDREFEVYQLIGHGRSTKEIAHQLHLSEKTVAVHRAHIKEKLELASAGELTHHAIRWVEGQTPGVRQ